MNDRPVFDQVNIVVRDMEAMAGFYRLLGVEVEDAPAPWDRHHRTVEVDGVDLDLDSGQFATKWSEGWSAERVGVVLGFRVAERSSVDETYDRLIAAGHRSQQPPYDAFWGARYAIVEDPDGNAVGIMSAVDPDKRTRPPTPE